MLAVVSLWIIGEGFLFIVLYAALMAFFFVGYIGLVWRQVAFKSVAFGLLCLVVLLL